jgi:thymidylate synthase (FAD)
MVRMINKKENIFGDNIAFVENWDFSIANMNDENRINAITQVASICYQNPKALNSDSLYNRLMAESIGLPSSSFEFVPVLLSAETIFNYTNYLDNCNKFGEYICNEKYLLTNLRALIEDVGAENSKDFYNTESECEIIKRHFKVFLYKVDFSTRSQMVRHRVNWQELSRRYVSGKRVPFDFYISEKMKDVTSDAGDTQKVLDICLEHYYKALEDGVKPQEARRIIPQAGYSQIWGGFQPTQLENYFKLRLDSHAQWEIRKTAEAMKELLGV